jgi:IclR family transcriptional regulator, KDG regulon repressor
MSTQLTSVSNALRVLKSFSSSHHEWGVSDLARALGLGKSTVHRLLSTMVEERVLEQHPITGRYRLGLAIIELAGAVPKQMELHEALLSPMSELRAGSGETVQAAVLDGRHVVYIERLDSPHTLRMFLEIGRRNHAHCTATGKVLLAHLADRELDRLLKDWDLPAETAQTVTDRRVLRVMLRKVRAQGYAENRGESEVGTLSIAAPVRTIDGKVVAALSLAGPAERIDPHREGLIRATQQAAAIASRRLGFRGAA